MLVIVGGWIIWVVLLKLITKSDKHLTLFPSTDGSPEDWSQEQQESMVDSIQALLHQHLVTSMLNSNFRNVLEIHIQVFMDKYFTFDKVVPSCTGVILRGWSWTMPLRIVELFTSLYFKTLG